MNQTDKECLASLRVRTRDGEEFNPTLLALYRDLAAREARESTPTAQKEPAPTANDTFYINRRVNMPPMRQLPHESVFVFPCGRTCITIKTRILHSHCGVRKELAYDLVALGIGHGFIRRTSATEVEVLVVLPNLPKIDLYTISVYFAVKWAVMGEDYAVEHDNLTDVSYLRRGIVVYKSNTEDSEGRSMNEDLDTISVDGYTVVSDNHEI